MPPIHPPTDEQQAAIDLFASGSPLVIEAFAGTGKTSTLGMMARARQVTGTALAFNKAIVNDFDGVFPVGVDCRTVNSLAWRTIQRAHPDGRGLLARLNGPRVSPWQAAKILGLNHESVVVEVPQPEGPNRRKVLQPTKLASHVMAAIRGFCYSADLTPGVQHFPYLDGLDPRAADGRRTHVNNRQLAKHLLPWLEKAWADQTNPNGELGWSHDCYVKLWQMGRYEIPGEFVLLDEAQDVNPVVLDALNHQTGKQIVAVGDTYQSIYQWRGSINALGSFGEEVPRTFLTRSWRFGDAVAEVANAILACLDAPAKLTGNPGRDTQVHLTRPGPPADAVLCRTNGAAVNAVLSYQAQGLNPHLVGGTEDIVAFAHAAVKLQAGNKVSHRDLACFDDWREVQDYCSDDPAGSDLRTMVKMLDDYGPQIVIDALTGLVAEAGADVVVSTAHAGKGREWASVRLAGDFQDYEGSPIPPEELRLLYVAATRATHHLDLSGCAPLRRLLSGSGR